MIHYFIEVSIAWALFYSIFYFFLRKETFFNTNRWYLIHTLWIGAIFPFLRKIPLTFETVQPIIMEPVTMINYGTYTFSQAVTQTVETSSFNYQLLVIALYFTGVLFFGFKMLVGLRRIRKIYLNGSQEEQDGFTLVISKNYHLPFSFLNYVFLHESFLENQSISEILDHEKIHVKSRHTYDVLFLELMSVLFWWNPIIYLYKKAIRQTHEYVADAYASQNTHVKNYGRILLGQSSSGIELALTNQFFNSHLKKRITMLYKKKSAKYKLSKYLLVIPFFCFLAVLFSSNTFISDNDDILSSFDPPQKLVEKINLRFDDLQGESQDIDLVQATYQTFRSEYPNDIDYIIYRAVEKAEEIGYELSYDFENDGSWSSCLTRVGLSNFEKAELGIARFKNKLFLRDKKDIIITPDNNQNNETEAQAKRGKKQIHFLNGERYDMKITTPFSVDGNVEVYSDPEEIKKMFGLDGENMIVTNMTGNLKVSPLQLRKIKPDSRNKIGEPIWFELDYSNAKEDKIPFISIKGSKSCGLNDPADLDSQFKRKSENGKILYIGFQVDQLDLINDYVELYVEVGSETLTRRLFFHENSKNNYRDYTVVRDVNDHSDPELIYDGKDDNIEVARNDSGLTLFLMGDSKNLEVGKTYTFKVINRKQNKRIKGVKISLESSNGEITIPKSDEEGYLYEFEYTPSRVTKKGEFVTISATLNGEVSTMDVVVLGEGESINPQPTNANPNIQYLYNGKPFDMSQFDSNEIKLDGEVIYYNDPVRAKQEFGITGEEGAMNFIGTITNFPVVNGGMKLMTKWDHSKTLKVNHGYAFTLINTDKKDNWDPKISLNGSPNARLLMAEQTENKVEFIVETFAETKTDFEFTVVCESGSDKIIKDFVVDVRNPIKKTTDVHVSAKSYLPEHMINPLIVINGKVSESKNAHYFTLSNIKSTKVLSRSESISKYGNKQQDGALEVNLITVNGTVSPSPAGYKHGKDVFKVVQEMPRFPGCEVEGWNKEKRSKCAEGNLIEWVYENLEYPEEARQNKVEGNVYIQFIVEKDGSVSNFNVVRDIGSGCGESALTLLQVMGKHTKWRPGMQNGQPVRVLFTLPIKFRLNEKQEIKTPFKLYQNETGSISSTVIIGFDLPEERRGILKIYDVEGKVLKSMDDIFNKGHNKVEFDLSEIVDHQDLYNTQALYYSLESGSDIDYKKIIRYNTSGQKENNQLPVIGRANLKNQEGGKTYKRTIYFDLPRSGKGTLFVYNAVGKHIHQNDPKFYQKGPNQETVDLEKYYANDAPVVFKVEFEDSQKNVVIPSSKFADSVTDWKEVSPPSPPPAPDHLIPPPPPSAPGVMIANLFSDCDQVAIIMDGQRIEKAVFENLSKSVWGTLKVSSECDPLEEYYQEGDCGVILMTSKDENVTKNLIDELRTKTVKLVDGKISDFLSTSENTSETNTTYMLSKTRIITDMLEYDDYEKVNLVFTKPGHKLEKELPIKLLIIGNPVLGNSVKYRFNSDVDDEIKVYVADMMGRSVGLQSIKPTSGSVTSEINIEPSEPGIYSLTVVQGNSRVTKRFIVQ